MSDVYLVISYVPMLYSAPKKYMKTDDDETKRFFGRCQELMDRYSTQGIGWGYENGTLQPALIVADPKLVYEHLMVWCEGKPEDWFTCVWDTWCDGYKILIVPNIEKSVRRFTDMNKIDKADIKVIFHKHGTKVKSSPYFKIEALDKKEIKISFASAETIKACGTTDLPSIVIPCIRYSELEDNTFYKGLFEEET